MTCIAGIAAAGRVWVAGDSFDSFGYTALTQAAGKVFRVNDFIIGCAGNHRFADLVRYSLQLPPLEEGADVDAFMAIVFAANLRDCLRKGGHLDVQNVTYESTESVMLVGVRGNLYVVDSEFSVVRPQGGVGAVGSGAEVALGALHVTPDVPPERRLRAALEAAERWTDSVRAPFTIESL